MNYPCWWNTQITLYNRHEDMSNHIVTWHKTVISDCFFKSANNKVTIGQTEIETNNIIIRIPFNDKFKNYSDWIKLSDDEREEYFTLHQGDIIIKSAVEDEIDECTKGKRSTDFLAKYKETGECFVVKSWQDNTGAGRCAPHYYVSGE